MTDNLTLDPTDWDKFSKDAHDMLDAAIAQMRTANDGPVWSPLPDDQKHVDGVSLSPSAHCHP